MGFVRALVFGGPPLVALLTIARLAVNTPFTDEWRWAKMIVLFDAGRLTLAYLWRPEFGHRIFFPSLIALWLSRFGGWNCVNETFTSWALSAATATALYRLILRTLPSRTVLGVFSICAGLVFSLGQLENWLWGFQFSWFLTNLCAVLMCSILSAPRLGVRHFAAAGAAAIVAAYSLGQGLALFPAAIAPMLARRTTPLRGLGAWAILSVAAFAFYAHDLPAASALTAAGIVRSPLQIAAFFCVLVGAPLTLWTGSLAVMGSLGLIGLIAGVALLVRYTLVPTATRARAGAWVGVLLFASLGSALIAVARGQSGLAEATAGRYVTLTSMIWIGLLPLGTVLTESRSAPGATRAIIRAGLALLISCIVMQNAFAWTILRADHDLLASQRALVLRAPQFSPEQLTRGLFPSPAWLTAFEAAGEPRGDELPGIIAALKADREGPFAAAEPSGARR